VNLKKQNPVVKDFVKCHVKKAAFLLSLYRHLFSFLSMNRDEGSYPTRPEIVQRKIAAIAKISTN